MKILVSTIATQFRSIILVCPENCNNLTITDLFQSVRSALERSTPVDSIAKDTKIGVSGNTPQVKNNILFVVTNLITP
jgi:hypothetical protein